MSSARAFWNSPVGPKTTHFWGPTLNSLFVVQGLYEWNRPAEKISRNMQFILSVYSALFMRFALVVKPTNYFLFSVHLTNCSLQSNLLVRRLRYEYQPKVGIQAEPVAQAQAPVAQEQTQAPVQVQIPAQAPAASS